MAQLKSPTTIAGIKLEKDEVTGDLIINDNLYVRYESNGLIKGVSINAPFDSGDGFQFIDDKFIFKGLTLFEWVE